MFDSPYLLETKRKIYETLGIIEEISEEMMEHVPDLDETNLDYIFGDKTRIATPLDSGKKFKVPLETILDGYDIDYKEWVAFKKGDTEKKNPTKIGKALNKVKRDRSKKLQNFSDIYGNAKARKDIADIEELLKTTDLKAQVNSGETELYTIYSRSPIDVVRMSDDPFEGSCHSEGESEFKCALADAQNNAGIVYLVTKEEFDNIEDLQAEELIVDNQRGVEGSIENPLARIRLRKLIDSDGNSQVIPTLRVYSKSSVKYEKIFKDEIIEWSRDQVNSKFNWDDTLTMVGGSYEDVSVKDMAKKIFGKDISYRKSQDEADFENLMPDFENLMHFEDDLKMIMPLEHPIYGENIDYGVSLDSDSDVLIEVETTTPFSIDLDPVKSEMNEYLNDIDWVDDDDVEEVVLDFLRQEDLSDQDDISINNESYFKDVTYSIYDFDEYHIDVDVVLNIEMETTAHVEVGDFNEIFLDNEDYFYSEIDYGFGKIKRLIESASEEYTFGTGDLMRSFKSYVEDLKD